MYQAEKSVRVEDVARALQLSIPAAYRFARGEFCRLSPEQVEGLSRLTGKSPNDLFGYPFQDVHAPDHSQSHLQNLPP